MFCAKSDRKFVEVRKYLWDRKKNVVVQRRTVKYVEAAWRFLFYSAFCYLGYQALFVPTTASWVTTTMNCYTDWPLHELSPAIALYYQVQLGSYFHQLLWTEVNRSDALEMLSHHVITIALLIGSFLTNYTRIGSVILFIHDWPDVLLESAKCLNYTSQAKSNLWIKPYVDILFVCFMITFFVTRLMIYPKRILYSLLTEGYSVFGCDWGGCYFFVGLLSSLQVLHIFWFYLIARMAYRLTVVGEVEKDVRSDDEDEMGDEPPAVSDDDTAEVKKASKSSATSTSTSTQEDAGAARRRKK